jgi:methyl-accepting chemotaxis protein
MAAPESKSATDYPVVPIAVALLCAVAAAAALAVHAAEGTSGAGAALAVAIAAAVLAVFIVVLLARVVGQWRSEVASARSAAATALADHDGNGGRSPDGVDVAAVIKALAAERSTLHDELAMSRLAPQVSLVQSDALRDVVAEAQELNRSLSETVENVLSIATASEELSASSAEIALCASEATRVSSDAVRLASQAMTHVDSLRENGTEAARIVTIIHSLAERTRVLSLNTMIEAGRAGDAGLAMGAIATNIRALAEDAAKGTQSISTTLAASAKDISEVDSAIGQVTDIATEVQHYQAAIATAVEQQTVVTGEIAQAAHQAERLGADVSRQLEQLAANLSLASGADRHGADT